MWFLVERPPREWPRALRRVPPSLRLHADATGHGGVDHLQGVGSSPPLDWPPAVRPRALSGSTSGTGGERPTTCPPPRAGRERVSPCARSRRSHRARDDDQRVASPASALVKLKCGVVSPIPVFSTGTARRTSSPATCGRSAWKTPRSRYCHSSAIGCRRCRAAALDSMYVVEGSTLGGAVIAKQVERAWPWRRVRLRLLPELRRGCRAHVDGVSRSFARHNVTGRRG